MGLKVWILSFLLTFALPFLASADAQVCKVREIKSSELAGRGFEIDYPNGMNIQVVGHNHGIRQSQHDLRKILIDTQIPNQRVAELSQSWMNDSKMVKPALVDFVADVEYLKKYLGSRQGPLTLWAEGSDGATQAIVSELSKSHKERGEGASKLMRQYLFSSASPTVFAASVLQLSPQVRVKGIETVTPELDALNRASLLYGRKAEEFGMSSLDSVPSGLLAEIQSRTRPLLEALETNDQRIYDNWDMNQVYQPIDRSTLPPQIKTALKYQALSAFFEFKGFLKRDQQNVENLLSEGQSSLLFIGAAHVKPMSVLLEKKCREAMGPARAPLKPAASGRQ